MFRFKDPDKSSFVQNLKCLKRSFACIRTLALQDETIFATRIAAIRDAKKKAEAMATELGATLQGVQRISDSRQRYYVSDPFGGDPFGAAPSSDDVAAGQMKISASVNVSFRLTEADFE